MKISEKQLRSIIRESLIKKIKTLNEGMTNDNPAFKAWFYLVDTIGADAMIEKIFNYLDSSELERIIECFEEDGYFEGSDWNEDMEEDNDFNWSEYEENQQ